MPFPGHPEYHLEPYEIKSRQRYGCLLALAGLTLFTLIIWGGCAAAYRAQREAARQQEIIDAYSHRR